MPAISSRWSRFWGAISAVTFWVGLGAAIFDAAVIAPLWTMAPPQSVRAWAELAVRPEAARFFVPLAAVVALATALAWLSDLGVRGTRRWWLTIAAVAAVATAWASIIEVRPIERVLVAAAAEEDLRLIGLAGQWLQWSLLRLVALAVGSYAAYRAHLVAVLARRQRVQPALHEGFVRRAEEPLHTLETRTKARRRRPEDFVWSEDDEGSRPRHKDF